MRILFTPISVLVFSLITCAGLAAQPTAPEEEKAETKTPAEPDAATEAATDADAEQAKRFEKFTSEMSSVKLVGHFTVTGQQLKDLPKEEYEIRSVKKLPNGDLWLLTTRIKYGDHDLTLPLPLDIKWAGDTPVITLTDLTIPGLGTFSARVVLHEGKYAGTWRHGEVGGHLFGTIEKLAP